MNQKEHLEYEDITYLLKTPEWRSWINFIESRAEYLTKKALSKVKDGEYDEAGKLVAIINDIKTQIHNFKHRKTELEQEE